MRRLSPPGFPTAFFKFRSGVATLVPTPLPISRLVAPSDVLTPAMALERRLVFGAIMVRFVSSAVFHGWPLRASQALCSRDPKVHVGAA